MENVSLSIIHLRTNKTAAENSHQTFLNKAPDFQRSFESWDDKLRTRFIESIILNRATNPIWTVYNEEDDSEEILDGMHRITTAINFLDNKFKLNESYLTSIEKEVYGGKYFKDLRKELQLIIRSYNFVVNKLDSSYRNNRDKLKDMYDILNRSSKPLNNYEFNKVLYNPFYDLIKKHKDAFLGTNFFFSRKDKRGQIDSKIIEMLALSYPLPDSWSSLKTLAEDWMNREIGNNAESISNFIRERPEEIETKLSKMINIIRQFQKDALFDKDKLRTYDIEYKMIVSRCTHHSDNISDASMSRLVSKFRKHICIPNLFGGSSRNSTFQQKLSQEIDKIIRQN